MLTENSVKKAIPVIFISNTRNSLFITVLLDKDVNKSIIADTLSIINIKIITPAIIDTYITNSGLYCFKIIIIISAINPTPIIFIISIVYIPFYKLNIVLTVVNNVLISFITIDSTITSPASVVIIAWSSLPALVKTWCNTATSIPIAAILNNKFMSIIISFLSYISNIVIVIPATIPNVLYIFSFLFFSSSAVLI